MGASELPLGGKEWASAPRIQNVYLSIESAKGRIRSMTREVGG